MYKSAPVIFAGLLMGISNRLLAAPSLEDRLARVEKLLSNQVLMDQMVLLASKVVKVLEV